MQPTLVVEPFQVLEDGTPRYLSTGETPSMHEEFGLQGGDEVLHHRVVKGGSSVSVCASLSPREPREELAPQVNVAPLRDGVPRQPRCHPLELRLAYPLEARRLLRVHDLPAAGELPGDSLNLLEDHGLQECVQAGVLMAPHALQSSLSGPAVPDFLGEFLEQAAETLGEPLLGASNGPTEDPTPVKPKTVGGAEGGAAREIPAKRRFM
jgi:hypothetical protein